MKRMSDPARIDRLRDVMREEKISSLLVTRREDVRYLSGFTGSAGSLLVTHKKACLLTDFRYKLQAEKEKSSGIAVCIQARDHYSAIGEAAEQLAVDVLAIDESSITVEAHRKLKKLGLRTKGRKDLVRILRLRKDHNELKNIKLAIYRAEESFRALKRFIRPGVTERKLANTLESIMKKNGSRRAAFDTIVASGRNGAMPHASITDRALRSGDLVTFDFGAEANGYYSDMTRTLCIGKPSARQLEVHSLVLKAQAAAMVSIKPGVMCKDVDREARDVIAGAGHGAHFGHGTGHGIGLMVHEGPAISPLSVDRVETGMVFTVEPGVYISGWGGVRIEDMVLSTPKGYSELTTLPKGLDLLHRV